MFGKPKQQRRPLPQSPHLPQATDGLAVAARPSKVSSQEIGKGGNYGIRVLYDGVHGACVDIVFVHGLTGNAYDTWLHEETGVHWPSQLFGQQIPDIRVLSFGYDADVFHFFGKGASNSRLTNHAESLVGKLVRERARDETEERKIIFVAHSLGGLLVEQALVHSKNSAEPHLNQVERNTIGIVFLGVPHCGSDLEAWATIGRRMVGMLKRTNSDILDVLNPDSEMLHLVENNFHTILRQRKNNPIEITGFYEELPVKGIGEIVPQRSAKIAGYSFYGIHADHQNMTKFSSPIDDGYDSIVGEVQRWVRSIRLVKQKLLHTDLFINCKEGSDICELSAAEYDCFQSFYPIGNDYESQKDQNPRRISGTCLWALEHPKYLSWRDSDAQRMILISADPGCGKSVLAKCIVDEDLPNAFISNSPRRTLYFFFKDTSLEQRSASRALCAVLHQLFTFHPRLIRHALPKYKEKGAALSSIFLELWSIFMKATADPIAGDIVCVLDALDECNDQERPKLIECLENVNLGQGTSPSISRLKFLVTSRPYFGIQRGFFQSLEASNNIELAGNAESSSIKKEIDLVIEYKVAKLKRELCLSQEVTDHLRERLLKIEHRTYLWLYLLWEIIQTTLSGTKSGLDRLIDNLPDNIQASYEILLEKSPDRDFAKRVLQIVLTAARPLTLDEMDIALHIDAQTLSYAKLEREGSDRLRKTLPTRCGLIVSIIGDKVYYIHQTVKEFLLTKIDTQIPTGRVWQQSLDLKEAQKILAEACVQFLSFPEIQLDQTNILNALLPEDHRNMEPNIYCQRYSFLSYSAIYWADHCRGLNGHQRTKFIENALKRSNQSSVIGESDFDYGTVLHAASAGGHLDIVQILLDTGADINAESGMYGTAVLAAFTYNHFEIVDVLARNGARVDAADTVRADANAESGTNDIGIEPPVTVRRFRMVSLMPLDDGAEVNAGSRGHSTALQAASTHGDQASSSTYQFLNILEVQYGTRPLIHAERRGYSTAFEAHKRFQWIPPDSGFVKTSEKGDGIKEMLRKVENERNS